MMTAIDTGKHEVVVTGDIKGALNGLFESGPLSDNSSCFVLADKNTAAYCYPLIKSFFPSGAGLIVIEGGEDHKNLQTCEFVWNHLLNNHADRKSVLLNLGGGVVTDIGGFVASAYKRGIKFVNIPTSLLAMVDASCGGKTGVDLSNFKNMIGTFAFPETVFVDPAFLNTLPDKEWRSGMAEMYKHALLDSTSQWNTMKNIAVDASHPISDKSKALIGEQIYSSIKYKAKIVASDPYEINERKYLNFGHTIGHAVETTLLNKNDHTISHGEAITIGMICELFISNSAEGLQDSVMKEAVSVLKNLFSKRRFNDSDVSGIIEAIKSDKKSDSGKISFALLQDVGKPVIKNNINDDLVIHSIQYYNSL